MCHPFKSKNRERNRQCTIYRAHFVNLLGHPKAVVQYFSWPLLSLMLSFVHDIIAFLLASYTLGLDLSYCALFCINEYDGFQKSNLENCRLSVIAS
jgi:hypothetical protein